MAIKITEECINCGACEPECPNNAIYEGGVEWAIADGSSVKGSFTLLDGSVIDANQRNAPISVDMYYIVPINAPSARASTKSPSAPPSAPSTAAFPTKCIVRRWKNC